MAQIRNRYDIQNSFNEDMVNAKKLPMRYDIEDGLTPYMSLSISLLIHVCFIFLLIIITIVQHLVFPKLPKPELPNRTIEFKLVQNESKPPINRNTKIRSDRDSRAGGIHDPKKPISQPNTSVPSKNIKQQQKQQTPKTVQKSLFKQQTPKPTQPKIQTQAPQPQKTVTKPTITKPSMVPTPKPVVKPTVKPLGVIAPTAPKIATAPKSPFVVSVPSANIPMGTTYKPSGAQGGGSSAPSGSNSAPVPKFSSSGGQSGSKTGTSSGASSGGQYAARGSSGGYGSSGNPSPGNPNGAPGIDALRQPNWGPYMRNLEQRIKRNWTPPKGDSSKRVVIHFVIARDGRLLSAKVAKSSGVPLADRAAMSAVELTAPFSPLPPEFREQSVQIEFTFDYNVINSIVR